MHHVSQQKKVPPRASTASEPHRVTWLCVERTLRALRGTGWSFSARRCASSWGEKKKRTQKGKAHGSHVTLAQLLPCKSTALNVTLARFINKKNRSQHGPYLLASFHACAVTRICCISGTLHTLFRSISCKSSVACYVPLGG